MTKVKLTKADIDILSGSINRQVRERPEEDAAVKQLYREYIGLLEFETNDYPPGTMFMFWWENLMSVCGFFHGVKHSWETAEMSRSYWDTWHERKRKAADMKWEQQNSIEVPIWWKSGGGMMYRRDCLPPDHPEHTYNYIKRLFRVDPEDYGVAKPPEHKKCPHCGHPID